MSKKKRFYEREEGEGGEENPQEETPQGEGPDDSEEDVPQETGKKDSGSLTGKLNAKIGAIIAAALIVGIVVGQLALPGLGIGLISLPAEGGDTAVDMTELQAKVQDYLYENFMEPQGVEGEVLSIESFSDSLYIVEFEVSKDGQTQGRNELFLTKDGLVLIAGPAFLLDEPVEQLEPQQPSTGPPNVGEVASFTDSGYDLELEDGKPVIRLFSSTACGYCLWIKDTFEEVAKEYVAEGKIVAYHWELNTGDNTLTPEVETEVPAAEREIFDHFNPGGGVPTFVFGGKYYRIGVRYRAEDDLDAEAADFRAVIEALLEEASQ